MPSALFWIFAVIMLIGGMAVISLRNPVASALSVVVCFIAMAGLFVGLDASFVGVIQVLVYTGAIMVLFLFIIMLLDLKSERLRPPSIAGMAAGLSLVLAFVIQLIGVLGHNKDLNSTPLDPQALSAAADSFTADGTIANSLRAGNLPDVHLIGHTLFTGYNLPLQILGVLLLVATIGVVVLSKKTEDKKTEDRR